MFSVVSVFSMPAVRAADPDATETTTTTTKSGKCFKSFLGLPHWYEYLEVDSECRVSGPLKEDSDSLDMTKVITRVSLAIIDILMRVGGMVAFGFIVYSGFRFVMSQGNPDQEKAARETAINALIGMVITIFAIAIVSYIGNRLASS